MNPIIKPTSISIKPTFNQSVVRQLLEARLRRPQIVKKWVAAFRDGHRQLTVNPGEYTRPDALSGTLTTI